MAAAINPSLELGPLDNPFALLGLRRTSIADAMKLTNADYAKAFRNASKILHPDKAKDQSDTAQVARMSEQFRKASLAKELLVVDEDDHVGLVLGTRMIQRYLWTEQDLQTEGLTTKQADGCMLNEQMTRDFMNTNLGHCKHTAQDVAATGVRVLPGISLLQGTLL